MSVYLGLGLVTALYFVVWYFIDRAVKEHNKQRYEDGYEFAKQALLTGKFTRNQLLEMACRPLVLDEFDRGIRQAVSDYTHDRWKIEDLEKIKNVRNSNL